MVRWERTKGVVLEPIVDRLTQKFKDHADMIPVNEDLHQVQTIATKGKQDNEEKNISTGRQFFATSERHLAESSKYRLLVIIDPSSGAVPYKVFLGSLFLSVLNTHASILLASLYFCTALITLMAQCLPVSRS